MMLELGMSLAPVLSTAVALTLIEWSDDLPAGTNRYVSIPA
jgi:hypothetical protein